MRVMVRVFPTERVLTLWLPESSLCKDVKTALAQSGRVGGLPPREQRLLHRATVLADDDALWPRISNRGGYSVLHLVLRGASGAVRPSLAPLSFHPGQGGVPLGGLGLTFRVDGVDSCHTSTTNPRDAVQLRTEHDQPPEARQAQACPGGPAPAAGVIRLPYLLRPSTVYTVHRSASITAWTQHPNTARAPAPILITPRRRSAHSPACRTCGPPLPTHVSRSLPPFAAAAWEFTTAAPGLSERACRPVSAPDVATHPPPRTTRTLLRFASVAPSFMHPFIW